MHTLPHDGHCPAVSAVHNSKARTATTGPWLEVLSMSDYRHIRPTRLWQEYIGRTADKARILSDEMTGYETAEQARAGPWLRD